MVDWKTRIISLFETFNAIEEELTTARPIVPESLLTGCRFIEAEVKRLPPESSSFVFPLLEGIRRLADDPDNTFSESCRHSLLSAYFHLQMHFPQADPGAKRFPLGFEDFCEPGIVARYQHVVRQFEQLAYPGVLVGILGELLPASGRSGLTPGQFQLISVLVKEASCVAAPGTDVFAPTSLPALLIRLQMNDVRFLSWCQQQVYTELEQHRCAVSKLLAVLARINAVKAIGPVGWSPLYPQVPSPKAYLLNVLEEEFRNLAVAHWLQPVAVSGKLTVNLSVAELSGLIKLLSLHDVFRVEHTRELLRFAAGALRSKRAGDFSFRTLSKEFYGMNQFTAASLRDLLQRMLTWLNRTYFPVIALTATISHYV